MKIVPRISLLCFADGVQGVSAAAQGVLQGVLARAHGVLTAVQVAP
jgi:hypothetical protein